MSRFLTTMSVLLGMFVLIHCGTNTSGNNDAATAQTNARSALSSTGTAHVASFDVNNGAISALLQEIQSGALTLSETQALAVDGNANGANNQGTVAWSGDLTGTDNLTLTFTFTDYAASAGGALLGGTLDLTVSLGSSSCSGIWNFDGLNVTQGSTTMSMTSDGSGLTLSGTDCEAMTLAGTLDVSGDVTANNCTVTGTVGSPAVDC